MRELLNTDTEAHAGTDRVDHQPAPARVMQQRVDALLPPEMARQAVEIGVKKASMDAVSTLVLAVLAGAFISLGAIVSIVALAGTADMLPFGVSRVLAGLVFSLGLILVVIGGAELFTGNNLIVMAWASRRISTGVVLRNWALVFIGNFVGALGTSGMVVLSGHLAMGDGIIGRTATSIAAAKLNHSFIEAVFLGILCNVLVCLAVWLSYSARTTTDRVLAVVPPIATFVAAGFEHCVANMYFIPVVLLQQLIHGETVGSIDVSWQRFLTQNLLPVTLGNVVGGAGLVGIVYWFIYLRKTPQAVA